MTYIDSLSPALHKSSEPPLSHPGATPDSERAKRPRLMLPPPPLEELHRGDRVERLGNFGTLTGELGTVERTNEEDAVVMWDAGRRMRLRQLWLKKIQ